MTARPYDVSFEPLTPLSYLDRAAEAHGDRVGVIDGDQSFTYADLHDRSRRLAGALIPLANRQPVAVLDFNTHNLLEAHFGVPWSGSPLVAINTRLAAGEIAGILGHCEAAVLIHGPGFDEVIDEAVDRLPIKPIRIRIGAEYEHILNSSPPRAVPVTDERALLAINYTSGTTGAPKGVMYHHRGAYLQSLAMVGHTGLSPESVHLWTLPMFHCNGWCFPWAVTAAAGVHVCLPKVDAAEVWRLIDEYQVTHLNGAPTVLSMIAYADQARRLNHRVRIATGGAPPTPAILRRMGELGFDVTHLYGLTETFGPAVICDWRPEWNEVDDDTKARLMARQGVGNMISQPVRVVAADGTDVPADGVTTGEIALRGNNVMIGYYKNGDATAAAVPDGWFRTGDIGVRHADGSVELRDRSKDVIISGGENIASVEVEQVIADHIAVLEVAVVGRPDEKWGEVPVAFVTPHPDAVVTEEDIISHVRQRLAHFKAPKSVVFGELPKTSTGKVKKFELRKDAISAPH